jgi:hypothetical protein
MKKVKRSRKKMLDQFSHLAAAAAAAAAAAVAVKAPRYERKRWVLQRVTAGP